MDIIVNLNFSDLYETTSRSLSIIGKRSVDDNGNLLFKDITLGTNEKEIIYDYFQQAIIDLMAETAAFISASTEESITLTLPTNHNTALEPFITKACRAYCVSFALYSWFTITAPRIASRYLDDCKRQLSAVIRITYEKTAPSAPDSSYSDVTGTVTKN